MSNIIPTAYDGRMKSITRTDFGVIAGIAALYGLLTFGGITRWSIWFDEAFSAYLMRFDMGGIMHYTAADVHPPFYYLVLKLWTLLFGTSDLALRSLSATAILAAIIAVYLFVRHVFGLRAALMSVALLALSPLLIRFGQEARMYGLVVLITTLATWLFWVVHQNPSRRKWVAYGVLVSIGMWTNYFTAFVWAAHWLWRLLYIGEGKKLSKPTMKQFFSREFIIAHVVAVVGFLAWIPFLFIQFSTIQAAGFWIRAVDIDTLTNLLTDNLLYLDHYEVIGWLAVLVMTIVSIVVFLYVKKLPEFSSEKRSALMLFILTAVVPIAALFVLSLWPLRPLFMDRYLLPSTVWLIVTAGIVLSLVVKDKALNRLSLVGFSLMILAFGIGAYNVYTIGNFNRASWETMAVKPVMEQIQASKPGVPILTDSPWRFYEAIQYDTPEHPVYFVNEDTPFGSYNMLRDSDFRKIYDLEDFVSQHDKIWYIGLYHDDKPHMPAGNWRVLKTIKGPQTRKSSGTTYAFLLERAD